MKREEEDEIRESGQNIDTNKPVMANYKMES